MGQSFKPALDYVYNSTNVLVTDVQETHHTENYCDLNALDYEDYLSVAKRFRPDLIIHLPALLSGYVNSNL